mgnify:CR=1 FL=1
MFRDEEIAFVYIYKEPVNIDELTLQKEEVESGKDGEFTGIVTVKTTVV